MVDVNNCLLKCDFFYFLGIRDSYILITMLERAWASNWERKTKTATDILEKRNNVNTKFSEMAESRTFGYNPPPDSSERTRLLRLKVRDNPKIKLTRFRIFFKVIFFWNTFSKKLIWTYLPTSLNYSKNIFVEAYTLLKSDAKKRKYF